VRCVEMVSNQTGDKNLKRILGKVAEDVAEGYTLAQSFEDHGEGLPATFIETIRAGEESGTLETSFSKAGGSISTRPPRPATR
jgi:type IV pilus assembly protein PilC